MCAVNEVMQPLYDTHGQKGRLIWPKIFGIKIKRHITKYICWCDGSLLGGVSGKVYSSPKPVNVLLHSHWALKGYYGER